MPLTINPIKLYKNQYNNKTLVSYKQMEKQKKKVVRSDKRKTMAKVAKAVLKNPIASEREIAKIAKVSNWSAHNHLSELEQTWALSKDPRIRAISDTDLQIVDLVQKETIVRLTTPKELAKINALDLNRIWDISIKRHSLIIWKATDELWWMNVAKVVSLPDLIDDTGDTPKT